MLRNFIQAAIQKIGKHKLIYLINTLGLSVSIACAYVIFVFVEFEYHVDGFHKDHERIFLLTETSKDQNSSVVYGKVPKEIGPALREELPQVEATVRMVNESAILSVDDKEPSYQHVTFADPDFFNVFTFPLERGNATELNDPSKVFISHTVAEKFFGTDDPIGKVVKINVSGVERALTVAGIAERFSRKRSFEFGVLINWAQLPYESAADTLMWQRRADATFVKLKDKSQKADVEEHLSRYVANINAAAAGNKKIESLGMQPLTTLALDTYKIRGDISRGYGPPSGRIAMIVIGVLLITISCLNYVNTSTALGVTRLKEIGVRKVLGSSRKLIITQFLVENLMLNGVAIAFGLTLAYFVFLPGFDSLFAIGLEFEFLNASLWIFTLVILLTTTFLSGAYPAFYISQFRPVLILQRNKNLGSGSLFSKIMLSFQYVLSLIYIVAGFLFFANEKYQRSIDLGYDDENVLVVSPVDSTAYKYFRTELSKQSDVLEMAGSNQQVGFSLQRSPVVLNGEESNVIRFEVEGNYFETIDLEVAAGELPDKNSMTTGNDVLVNERFVRSYNLSNPLNEKVVIGGESFYIRGVLKDFHYTSFQSEIEPVVFNIRHSEAFNFLSVKVNEGSKDKINEEIKRLWRTVSPGTPSNVVEQSSAIEQYFVLVSGHSKVMIVSAAIAVTLSSLGLFGLVYLNLSRKLKNYSVMKILGAETLDLVKQVSKGYFWYLLVAVLIGAPFSYYATRVLFSILYQYHVDVTALYPVLSILILFLITTVTISVIVIRVTRQNPVAHLRDD
jgi:putative ABC transport system permease protein